MLQSHLWRASSREQGVWLDPSSLMVNVSVHSSSWVKSSISLLVTAAVSPPSQQRGAKTHSQSRLHQPRRAAPTSRHEGIGMRITLLRSVLRQGCAEPALRPHACPARCSITCLTLLSPWESFPRDTREGNAQTQVLLACVSLRCVHREAFQGQPHHPQLTLSPHQPLPWHLALPSLQSSGASPSPTCHPSILQNSRSSSASFIFP